MGKLSPSDLQLLEGIGTIDECLILLLMSVSGGKNWGEVYDRLKIISWLAAGMFVFYIIFVVFGVLNVVTGAFVDSMRLVSQRDQDFAIEEELKRVSEFQTDVTKIFECADADDSGTLSWEEFESHLSDERVKAYFKSLELDTSEARALFILLDVEENNEVVIDKFVDGCMRMRGDAKSIDVNMLLYENEKMLCKVSSFTEYAEEQFDNINRELEFILTTCTGNASQVDKPQKNVIARKNSKEWLSRRRQSVGIGILPSQALVEADRGSCKQRRSAKGSVGKAKSRLESAINMIACCDCDDPGQS